VLGESAFRDIQPRQHLQARTDRIGQPFWQLHQRAQNTVNTHANLNVVEGWFNVNIRSSLRDRVLDDQVDDLDHGRKFRLPAGIRKVNVGFLAVAGYDLEIFGVLEVLGEGTQRVFRLVKLFNGVGDFRACAYQNFERPADGKLNLLHGAV